MGIFIRIIAFWYKWQFTLGFFLNTKEKITFEWEKTVSVIEIYTIKNPMIKNGIVPKIFKAFI